ncbi:MAG: hypothetical protein AAF215_11620 [Cyanobacteria bacterium P01_A01_bin.123]
MSTHSVRSILNAVIFVVLVSYIGMSLFRLGFVFLESRHLF